jgi:stage II sporulation protein R
MNKTRRLRMKKTLFPAFCILVCALLISVIPTEEDAAIYQDTIRLHILAPSDSTEDQELKLAVRDAILEKYSKILGSSLSKDYAAEECKRQLESIRSDCENILRLNGATHTVDVTFTEEWYNTREYSSFALPGGNYSSLKITLGTGEGQNWWCVMYPPICLDVCTEKNTNYTDEEYELISESGYNVKFKLLEVAALLFDEKK